MRPTFDAMSTDFKEHFTRVTHKEKQLSGTVEVILSTMFIVRYDGDSKTPEGYTEFLFYRDKDVEWEMEK